MLVCSAPFVFSIFSSTSTSDPVSYATSNQTSVMNVYNHTQSCTISCSECHLVIRPWWCSSPACPWHRRRCSSGGGCTPYCRPPAERPPPRRGRTLLSTQRSEVKRVRETQCTREVWCGTFRRVVNERRASVFQLYGLTVLERQRL